MFGLDDILRALLADLHIFAAVMAAIYLLAFVCAVREIYNSRTSQGSIAWLLSLALLPFPTAFLYMIFGWKFFDDYATDRIKNGRADRPLRAKDLALIDRETDAKWPVQVQVSATGFTPTGTVTCSAPGMTDVDATLSGGPVTVETAESAIRDLVKNREPKRIKIEDIQKLVASRYNVSRSDILSERRTAAVVKPRQIAMYLSKVLTLRSLPEIGRRFGGRDHTTVLHACRRIEALIVEDAMFRQEVDFLSQMLQRKGEL